jgi:hypothetical protein
VHRIIGLKEHLVVKMVNYTSLMEEALKERKAIEKSDTGLT